jgi:hypothetical protein
VFKEHFPIWDWPLNKDFYLTSSVCLYLFWMPFRGKHKIGVHLIHIVLIWHKIYRFGELGYVFWELLQQVMFLILRQVSTLL